MRNLWKSLPTWAKTIAVLGGVFVGLVFIVNSEAGSEGYEAGRTAASSKSYGEKTFSNRLEAYTVSSDNRVLVGFEAMSITRKSIEGDMKTFVRGLDKGVPDWTQATMSAYGTTTDAYGKSTKNVIYTITIDREVAAKVADWTKADVEKIGKVEFQSLQVRDSAK